MTVAVTAALVAVLVLVAAGLLGLVPVLIVRADRRSAVPAPAPEPPAGESGPHRGWDEDLLALCRLSGRADRPDADVPAAAAGDQVEEPGSDTDPAVETAESPGETGGLGGEAAGPAAVDEDQVVDAAAAPDRVVAVVHVPRHLEETVVLVPSGWDPLAARQADARAWHRAWRMRHALAGRRSSIVELAGADAGEWSR